nr:hypothetical protein [Actinomycetales bacterium]
MDKREIVRMLNTAEFRKAKGGVGAALAIFGLVRIIGGKGGVKRFLAGAVLAGSAAADVCATNLIFGYPLDGVDARAQLAVEDGVDGWEPVTTESPEPKIP